MLTVSIGGHFVDARDLSGRPNSELDGEVVQLRVREVKIVASTWEGREVVGGITGRDDGSLMGSRRIMVGGRRTAQYFVTFFDC